METEREEEVPEDRKLAEQGNTDAKLFVPGRQRSRRPRRTRRAPRRTRRASLRGRRLVVRRVARRQLELLLGAGGAGLELAAALELGVELGPEQHRDVGDPHPDQQGHDPAEGAVGLVVGAEVGHVEGEQARGEDPDRHREHAARRDPLELRQLRVRGGVVEDGDHQQDHQRAGPATWRSSTSSGRCRPGRCASLSASAIGPLMTSATSTSASSRTIASVMSHLDRAQLVDRPPLAGLVDLVGRAREGAHVARGREQRARSRRPPAAPRPSGPSRRCSRSAP